MAEVSPLRLSDVEARHLFSALDGWEFDAKAFAVRKSFAFSDFTAAFAFMTRVALFAERANHHPEWSNVFNRVDIVLTTHEAGGLSKRDFDLAQEIDRCCPSTATATAT